MGSRRERILGLVTLLLAVSGVACVGVAITGQRHAPQPTSAAAGPVSTPAAGSAALQVVGPVLAASTPVSLTIPAIGVRSPLLRLGQSANGEMEIPRPGPHYDEAGWYRYSPTPGSLGPAVIAGHVDSAANGPSVFFRLGHLRPRDPVLVARADGSIAVFTVDTVQRYAKAKFPTRLVYGDTDHAGLRLITCGGPFDRKSHNYLDNIVVFASLVRSTPAPASGRMGG